MPLLAYTEIHAVEEDMQRVVGELVSSSIDSARILLDAPEYLFVSTNLAKKFPDLMEVTILICYERSLKRMTSACAGWLRCCIFVCSPVSD